TWMLLRQRPAALVLGTALGMAVLLTAGMAIYNGWVNRGQDYPRLAAMVERHAQGGKVGITGGRFFSIDFYLGRALTPVRTPKAFDDWLDRPDQPISVITGRFWSDMRTQVRPEVEPLDMMRVRTQLMWLMRRTEPEPPRAGPLPSRPPAPR